MKVEGRVLALSAAVAIAGLLVIGLVLGAVFLMDPLP